VVRHEHGTRLTAGSSADWRSRKARASKRNIVKPRLLSDDTGT